MTKGTFQYILDSIKHDITKENLVGDTVSAEKRLAITVSRLTRGEYFYSLAEQYGVGEYKHKFHYNCIFLLLKCTLCSQQCDCV